ncbi:hypothetical protein [Sphingobium algorifonticola]|uniref:Uncharacterized protein n=1 Tax=Sphingobium algorifonticola TaxID=2008318 RepID=A0A437J9P8_9SPHN|nr:hypothetical protein [Sphingobium algorifonticola]RVT42110.1 hypothetical protein ENE74_07745 [Sphingobium algorifonticola]
MTDPTKRLRQLIEAIYLKTVAGEITWAFNPTSDACETDLGAGSIEVVQESDDDGNYYSYVKIRNSEQEVVENIYGGTLGKGARPFNTGHKNYWELLSDLRAQSYRSAMGADKIVASMLTQLDATDLIIDDDVPF